MQLPVELHSHLHLLLPPLPLLQLLLLPPQGFLNSMTQPPARLKDRMAPEKAECVSMWADRPTPGVYSLTVS